MNAVHAPTAAAPHVRVLCDEVVRYIEPRPGGTYVDATLGGGGHAGRFLTPPTAALIGIDRDPQALAATRARRRAHRASAPRWSIGAVSATSPTSSRARRRRASTGMRADLGVASPQLDRPDARLLLPPGRAARHAHGRPRGDTRARSAQRASEDELADILYEPRRRAPQRVASRAHQERLSRAGELEHHGRSAAAPWRALGPAAAAARSIRRRARSRRCASPSTTSSASSPRAGGAAAARRRAAGRSYRSTRWRIAPSRVSCASGPAKGRARRATRRMHAVPVTAAPRRGVC